MLYCFLCKLVGKRHLFDLFMQGTCASQRQSGLVGQFGQHLWPRIYAQPPSLGRFLFDTFAFSFFDSFDMFWLTVKGCARMGWRWWSEGRTTKGSTMSMPSMPNLCSYPKATAKRNMRTGNHKLMQSSIIIRTMAPTKKDNVGRTFLDIFCSNLHWICCVLSNFFSLLFIHWSHSWNLFIWIRTGTSFRKGCKWWQFLVLAVWFWIGNLLTSTLAEFFATCPDFKLTVGLQDTRLASYIPQESIYEINWSIICDLSFSVPFSLRKSPEDILEIAADKPFVSFTCFRHGRHGISVPSQGLP